MVVIIFFQFVDFFLEDVEWEVIGLLYVFVDEFLVFFGDENYFQLLDFFWDFLDKYWDGYCYQWIVDDSE